MTNEELEHGSFEIENRIRNLMWTISGDYDLDTKPDVTSFYKSKYISIYDAIKQGAFSRFFDKDAFALYLLKKVYLGADESQLGGMPLQDRKGAARCPGYPQKSL